MEVDEDVVWGAVATSLGVSPPATSLGVNASLQLPAFSGGPFLPAGSPFHPGGGCHRNVAASPSSSPFPCLTPLAAGPSPVAWTGGAAGSSGGSVAPEDRRKKRMIKNRETASRSRARKHTHVTNIESEVVELREANEQLRIKYDKLKAAVEVPMPVRKTLQRMLSAPF
ncbi:unnamed protein product [Alopecurus aequalis]